MMPEMNRLGAARRIDDPKADAAGQPVAPPDAGGGQPSRSISPAAVVETTQASLEDLRNGLKFASAGPLARGHDAANSGWKNERYPRLSLCVCCFAVRAGRFPSNETTTSALLKPVS